MTKLSSLKPMLGGLRPIIGRLPGREAYERERRTVSWRGWYKLGRWKRLRMDVLVRDHFTCQWPGCGKLEGDTSQLVADHRKPHRGDEALFWDIRNLWTLCKPHHDGAKQREEAAGRDA